MGGGGWVGRNGRGRGGLELGLVACRARYAAALSVSRPLSIRPPQLLQRRGIDGIGKHAPLAAGLGRRAGVAGAHGAGSRRKGPREERRAGELGDGSAHHCGDWLW
jgi:hypothetical protein